METEDHREPFRSASLLGSTAGVTYLPCFAESVASQDHVEGKLAHHRNVHFNKAVGRLLQQQSTAQVRVLRQERKSSRQSNPHGNSSVSSNANGAMSFVVETHQSA